MFLCSSFDVKVGLIQKEHFFWSIFSSMLLSLELTLFSPHLSGNMQQYNKQNNASVSQELFILDRNMNTLHEARTNTLSLKEHRHNHPHGASQHTVSHLISLCFPSISQSEKWEINVVCQGWKSLLFVYVLMPDDLVGDPIEDVEDEERQRKGCSGDSVYPLGSVHKFLPHGVYVLWDWWLWVRGWSSILNSWAVLCWQTLTHVVASKIKAAFTHIIILEKNKTKYMHMWTERT